MKHHPITRGDVYDLYWYFAFERQRIFEYRVSGQPSPWTVDPIMRAFKFCNVYRACDRVSQYMISNVCYHSEPCTPEDRLFQIVAFRIFSRIETWCSMRRYLDHYPTIADLESSSFQQALEYVKQQNETLYTGAFILCANDAYGKRQKHLNHIALLREMFVKDRLGQKLLETTSLREIYQILHTYPLIGDFMSYQLAIDLNYSDLINFSENDFTQPGPGALRGITKVFKSLGSFNPTEIILHMVSEQQAEFSRLGYPFKGLWGRALHAIDCQGLFCEVDKYCRAAMPELSSIRKRIKRRFAASPEPITLFFPPKWGINKYLPKCPVLGKKAEIQARLNNE